MPEERPLAYSITSTVTYGRPNRENDCLAQHVPKVPVSYPLFAHLNALRYFLTPGLRFGCDYTVYPGDPLRFHSHFLANGYGWEEDIPIMDIVGGGRLGTGVKKGFLLGGREDTSGGATEGSPVRTFCIEWAGM
jgi:tRNA-splicing endonuclease subunit Sen34